MSDVDTTQGTTPQGTTPQGTTPQDAGRINAVLIPKVADDLNRTRERSGLSKTDIVNRAISLYEFIDQELAAGSEVVLRTPDGKGGFTDFRVRLL